MSAVNTAFAMSALSHARFSRLDGRSAMEFREIKIRRGPLNGQAEVLMGKTLVRATVTGEVSPPTSDRPNEGRLFLNVDMGTIGDPAQVDLGRVRSDGTTLSNFVERFLKGSKAIDLESLCILGGKSVWSIRCDIHILNDDGSLFDATSLSVLAALLNFRCASVNVEGECVKVFADSEREPVPISIHHLPISSTFILSNTPSGASWLVDPCGTEERCFESVVTIVVNQHGELCGIHKPGGFAIDPDIVVECSQIAVQRAHFVSQLVREAFDHVQQ